jgi:hypothetical protein
VDAITISWKGLFNYIFPPFRLLEKLLDVTPIPYSLEHGIEIMHPLLDSDCPGHVKLSTLSGDLHSNIITFVSPIPDQKAWAVDAMTISCKGMFNYIFPPFRLLHKIREDGCKTILIAPAWPRQSWFLPEMCLVAFSEKPLSDRRPDSNHACRWSFSRP